MVKNGVFLGAQAVGEDPCKAIPIGQKTTSVFNETINNINISNQENNITPFIVNNIQVNNAQCLIPVINYFNLDSTNLGYAQQVYNYPLNYIPSSSYDPKMQMNNNIVPAVAPFSLLPANSSNELFENVDLAQDEFDPLDFFDISPSYNSVVSSKIDSVKPIKFAQTAALNNQKNKIILPKNKANKYLKEGLGEHNAVNENVKKARPTLADLTSRHMGFVKKCNLDSLSARVKGPSSQNSSTIASSIKATSFVQFFKNVENVNRILKEYLGTKFDDMENDLEWLAESSLFGDIADMPERVKTMSFPQFDQFIGMISKTTEEERPKKRPLKSKNTSSRKKIKLQEKTLETVDSQVSKPPTDDWLASPKNEQLFEIDYLPASDSENDWLDKIFDEI
jgi:hypothetical protein